MRGLNATEPCAQGEKGPSLSGIDLSTQWLLSGKAVSPPSCTSAHNQHIAHNRGAAQAHHITRSNASLGVGCLSCNLDSPVELQRLLHLHRKRASVSNLRVQYQQCCPRAAREKPWTKMGVCTCATLGLTIEVHQYCTHTRAGVIVCQGVHVPLVLLAQPVPQHLQYTHPQEPCEHPSHVACLAGR